jgi:hypothetical protein
MKTGRHVWRGDDGWLVVKRNSNVRLFKMGYHVGVCNQNVIIYHDGKVVFESEDEVLIDNYLKLLLED